MLFGFITVLLSQNSDRFPRNLTCDPEFIQLVYWCVPICCIVYLDKIYKRGVTCLVTASVLVLVSGKYLIVKICFTYCRPLLNPTWYYSSTFYLRDSLLTPAKLPVLCEMCKTGQYREKMCQKKHTLSYTYGCNCTNK